MSNQDDFSSFGEQTDDNEVFDFDSSPETTEEEATVGGMTPKKIGLFIALGIAIIVVVLLAFSRLSVTGKTEAPGKPGETTEVVAEEAAEGTSQETKPGKAEGLEEQMQGNAEDPEETSQSTEREQPKESAETFNQIRGESEVRSPEFQGDFSTGALVTDRFVLKNGSQYQFVIELSVSKGDTVTNLFYYSTKDAYDSIKLGDALKIHYTGDGVGGLAIKTVTKP